MRARRHKHFRQKTRFRILPKCRNLLGILWASPMSLAGLLLAIPVYCWHGRCERIGSKTKAIMVRGPLADWMLGNHPFGAMTAMALGHIVIAEQRGLSPRIMVHELEHVRQAIRWGPIFPFAYLASSAWAALRGQDAYWHNAFEIAARDAEKHVGREQAFLD